MRIARHLNFRMRTTRLAILLALAAGAAAAQPATTATFAGAWLETVTQYQAALRTLDTRGRDETAAAVQRLRQSFQQLAERFASDRPSHLAGDPAWPAEFMQIDVRLVGALLVIEMGSQHVARRSLEPLADTLARLRALEPPAR